MTVVTQDRVKKQAAHHKRAATDHRRTPEMAQNLTAWQRYKLIWGYEVQNAVFRLVRRLPGINIDRARLEPLKSDHPHLTRWRKRPFGIPGKPAALADIPWDYIREHEDTIPFLGLREYWYPAMQSRDLYHNEPKPVTLLGDNLVFFRDANGKACALEDRCPHRSPLLSLGQVGVVAPGTITCRYHGMTFDGTGACVAFIADGPDSPACTTMRARTYPVEEFGGVIWVYMGDKEPEPLMKALPYAKDVFSHDTIIVSRNPLPFNHLNLLDNSADVAHPGILHRSCLLFAGQKVSGQVAVEEMENGGLMAKFVDDVPHPGAMHLDCTEWHLPNFIFHHPGDLGGDIGFGYAWVVPNDIGNSTFWIVLAVTKEKRWQRVLTAKMLDALSGKFASLSSSILGCLDGGDVPMMTSQGRVARWDLDRLARIDRGIIAARKKLKAAHAAERAEREAAGRPHPRIAPPLPPPG
ncbi:MAG: Rieske 2Fe-2S domain-containing protein [Chloroflexales bacterium]|nr:Rieske 2Fe-2S domain-containing protein [Chloroflexales bacterium]